MKPRHLNCLAHFGDPPDGSIDVRESVYMYLYKEKIAREHLTGPQHYPDNGLVSGTRGEVSRNQEEEVLIEEPGCKDASYMYIKDKDLKEMCKEEQFPVLTLEEFLCHTQSVERRVKLISEAAMKVCGETGRDGCHTSSKEGTSTFGNKGQYYSNT
ncbi:hypothetical protein AVEN_272279-1 [Araneus ventricosus]|uniref:Uncharacterized protein n=1 Tax=Araneus ventricosus TaxID=182803 RepID=A0A4Y2QXK9_ARAVE|nr:hypothetical protein AVEN_272279-1 [Araneus ventricosus]